MSETSERLAHFAKKTVHSDANQTVVQEACGEDSQRRTEVEELLAAHDAATDLEKTRLLLKAGADVNAVSKLGNTPIMLAARSSKSSPVVRLLLGNRVDVPTRNVYGVSALMVAASSDDVETVKLLLDRGAKPSLAPYYQPLDTDGNPLDPIFGGGFNTLSWASLKGNAEIASLLIDAGADVNGQSMFGAPLAAAAQRNRAHVARLLLNRAADVNVVAPAGTWSPLMWAAGNEYGDADVLKLLIEHGADVNASHGASWGPQMSVPHSPLMITKRRGEKLLRKAGGEKLLRKAGGEKLLRKAEMDKRVARARDWPRRAEPRITEDHVYKLLGLDWAGEKAVILTPLVASLVNLQRPDGGWSQLPNLETDAYATGQALYALTESGGLTVSDEVVRNGLAYLIRNQMEDGSWFVRRRAYPFQPTMDPKFPHGRDAWISTAGTCWAVMALSVGLDKQDVARVLRAWIAIPLVTQPGSTRWTRESH